MSDRWVTFAPKNDGRKWQLNATFACSLTFTQFKEHYGHILGDYCRDAYLFCGGKLSKRKKS